MIHLSLLPPPLPRVLMPDSMPSRCLLSFRQSSAGHGIPKEAVAPKAG